MATINKINSQLLTQKAVEWLQKRSESKHSARHIPKIVDRNFVNKIQPGEMYSYLYKAEDSNLYYDRLPLIIGLGPAKGGFYGINLHYLPVKMRIVLLDKLISLANKNQLAGKSLLSTSKYKEIYPCIKRYAFRNVQSRFVKFKLDDWPKIALMPFQQFVGYSQQKVWNISKRIISEL